MDLVGIMGMSPIASTVAALVFSVLQLALLARLLIVLGRLRLLRDRDAGNVTSRHPLASALMLAGWIVIALCIGLLVRGNVTLVVMICVQSAWMFTVATAAYLTASALDGLASSALSRSGRVGRFLSRGFNVPERRLTQGGLLISAAIRILVFCLAILLVLAPTGRAVVPSLADLPELVTRTVKALFPDIGAGLRGAGVLVVGLVSLRLVSSWLRDTFLPTTRLDEGTRTSISTIVRYAGFAAVLVWAASTIGLGMDRIGLVASALSVGIGFGLQAITQNFISGLILLAERPVKVGDTIRVGEEQGDVRRISVRSTEIRIADHSTLIIPNSELITKSVRNMSMADPLGRVRVEFSTPSSEDADEVIALVRTLVAAHPRVLAEPRPDVRLESLVDEKILYVVTAFVSSPRIVADVRSDILVGLARLLRMRAVPVAARAGPALPVAGPGRQPPEAAPMLR
ncbi:mechanosensitive ion channel family protein [Aquibium microcysteis]|uniref:mechanosensitive ion channel family protein n=1 Tax=Aquibium microcysteis TaxID=675281 RepID=UPI00165CF283|nr:mechanosensitive ion channel domain-containing protein [Aquibium microcysteis]